MLWISLALALPCAEHVGDRLTYTGAFQFDNNSVELGSVEAVEQVFCALKREPNLPLHIEVHTDSRGMGSYNERISQQRADAIRTALIDQGIDGARLVAVGYGEVYPIDTNGTAAGRARNRRVELHTVKPDARPAAPQPPQAEAPQPAPAPVATVSWCVQLDRALAKNTTHEWALSGGLAQVVPRVEACLDGWQHSRDGGALYANKPGWSLIVRASDGAQCAVRLERLH